MGAMTVAIDSPADRQRMGHLDTIRGTLTFSDSYATGGDTLTAAALGYGSRIEAMVIQGVTSGGYVVSAIINPQTGTYTFEAFVTGTAANDALNQVAPATDLSAQSFRFLAWGI